MANPTGNELVTVQGVQPNGQPAATTEVFTTAQIAGLAALDSTEIVNTPIGATTGTILPAAGISGGLITRTGPTATFTDTTDSAANIIALASVVGASFLVYFKNSTAYTQTISAGAGVTLSVNNCIPPFSIGRYFVIVTSAATVSISHLETNLITDLNVSNPSLTTITNTTTMTPIVGLAIPIVSSGTYLLTGAVQINCTAGAGVALSVAASPSGTMTASSLNLTGKFHTATGVAVNTSVTFGNLPGNGIGTTAPVVLAEIVGNVAANAAGILQVYGGQQVANAGSTNILPNGFLRIERIQ